MLGGGLGSPGASRLVNGCFYEGVCQAPSNLDFTCSADIFSSCGHRYVAIDDSVAGLCVVDPSSCILRFKVRVYMVAEPVARSNFYPCRHQAGHHIPHARKALGPHPGYQRAPSSRTVACKQPAAVPGALTFDAHDASFSAMFRNVLCLLANGFELRPLRDQPVLEVAPQRNRQAPGQRHNADAAQALATTGEASVKPLAQFALRLVA